ncbi:hypothetical protein HFD07_11415 [Staphylococcus arlettae]|jgi:ABC-2 type transport system permease protein|uniref:ABC-2 transporter family protein n=1 Tax=Staphylococcus arlettae TaxID=29378 RepID=A0A380CAN5_9STAP|nr:MULTISPECIES: ABC transporter permease subunit [Staphylococcus]HAP2020388.1 hypothetical protein [Escherichia coli]MCE4986176.1 hypothetical protein [Staphylococcus arlettae]MEB5899429.1 hypothetical protein [Staphylococcus arlettae]NKE85733.1 hypothetical protein [Staphylococcus arlettae]PNZ53871.1 hypothetical protein CD036_07850 [Staphylococcus arlettae]
MNSFQLIKHDVYSIFRSPLTYLALLLTYGAMAGMTVLFVQQLDKVDGNIILAVGSWFFSIVGLLFVIKTITRDISQGTLQLFMNKTKNRVGYFIAKVCSMIIIALLMSGFLVAFVIIVQNIVDGKNVTAEKCWELLVFYLIFHLFFGLLLYLFALVIPKTALIYTVGIILIFLVPFAEPFIPMIPKIGDNIQDSLKYIPFSYLPNKTTSDDFTFTNWQWFISAASIIILFIVNLFYVTKKDI